MSVREIDLEAIAESDAWLHRRHEELMEQECQHCRLARRIAELQEQLDELERHVEMIADKVRLWAM